LENKKIIKCENNFLSIIKTPISLAPLAHIYLKNNKIINL